MTQYKSYTHLERYDKSDCEGILEGPCAVTAKVDATNAVVYFNDGRICAGSRKRALSENSDNGGFYNWVVNSNDEEAIRLRAFVMEYPQYMVYGEWMGSSKFLGAIKDYNPDALGHMYIFDVYDAENECYLKETHWRNLLESWELDPWFVELFGVYHNLTEEKIAEIAQNNKFLLDNANHPGEGVCIKRQDNWVNPWGHTVYGKFVLDEYKQVQKAPKKKKARTNDNVEELIVDKYVTDAEISKSIAKVCTIMNIAEYDNKNPQCNGRLITMCWNDLLEECKNWAKEFKNPNVNFAKLKGLCDCKVKKYIKL